MPLAASALPPIRYPAELPIAAHRDAIAAALREHPVAVVCGDTGSGKTTQLPKIALELGRGRIACTQPRRLAAVTVARRVAEEFSEPPGGLVGFQHRFERCASRGTRVLFMTDGILLAATRRDPLLRAYDTIVLDEAHERSLNIDFLLGLVRSLLPRRPDLKVVVSSATLDADRFAAFFDGAPVLRIPGRLHPIELRYRPPPEDDADLPRLVADAVDELAAEGDGDALVFLPGERDIRETAEVLAGRRLPATEIIPLLASLPAADQQRAFRLSSNRRIVLATNVAETSVTIPGIRFVIDSGLARISRYNPRTRVQRLHVEPVSQASANQRMGRCGRLGPGICVRLYDEADFRRRDPYTDPEIRRASLAGVILAMLDLRLGDIERFPLLDPPTPQSVREAYRELLELGALEMRNAECGVRNEMRAAPDVNAALPLSSAPASYSALRAPHSAFRTLHAPPPPDTRHAPPVLSPLGARLARLPVEPRLGRILLAAHDEHCLRDALIVVAAMEGDDPRRRPLDRQAEADKSHGRFRTPDSDFAALLRLWRWYETETAGVSQSAARRLCRDSFLSFPRMKEWRGLRDQLERLCRDIGLDTASAGGGDAGLHRALLAGLLGAIGKRDPDTGDYRGAHGLRFAIFPGSGLAKQRKHRSDNSDTSDASGGRPSRDWLVAGELVETSRLYARLAAFIDPAWIEPVAGALCKRSHHSPAWDADRGFVRVRERVTLHGLPIVENRLRDYSRLNPAESRAIFIRHGLVAGEFPRPPPPLLRNFARLDALRRAEEKTRRHGLLLDEERVAEFYDRRLPAGICSADGLRRWLRTEPAAAAALEFGPGDLPAPDESAAGFPDTIAVGGSTLALTYRHAPGETDDGIACTVPAPLLGALRAWRSEWLVPGALPDKIRWMLESLPGRTRRVLAPLDETVSMCLARLSPGREPLAAGLRRALADARGIHLPPETWRETDAPDHLRVLFRVVDGSGRELGRGRDLDALARLFAPGGAATPAAAPAGNRWQRDGLVCWDFGDVPERVESGRAGWPIVNYPALADQGASAGLRLFADAAEAAASHEAGVLRLLVLALAREWRTLVRPLSFPRPVAAFLRECEIAEAELADETGRAALRQVFLADRPAVRTAAAFRERLDACRVKLGPAHADLGRRVAAILHAAAGLHAALRGLAGPSAEDLQTQLAWLVHPGFVLAVPGEALGHYPRYLEGMRVRLERLALNPAGDSRKLAEFAPHWRRYEAFVTREPRPPHDHAVLAGYRWLLEEFRISLFAQELRTPAPVSARRLEALWAGIGA